MRSFVLLAALIAAPALAGEVSFTWQARVLDAVGAPVSGSRDLEVALFDADTGGTELWRRAFSAVDLADGYVALRLTGVDGLGRDLDAVDFGTPVHAEVSVAGVPMSPRQLLGMVPRAANAGSARGGFTLGDVPGELGDACSPEGTLRFHQGRVGACAGGVWQAIALSNGRDGSSASTPGRSCLQIKDDGNARGDGAYWLDPEGDGQDVFQAWCDMTRDGGGWTQVILSCTQYNGAGEGWGPNLGDNAYRQERVADGDCGGSTQGGKLADARIQAIWDASGQDDLMCVRHDTGDWVKNSSMNAGIWVWAYQTGYSPAAGGGQDYNSHSAAWTTINNTPNNYFGWWNNGRTSGCSCYQEGSGNWGCTTRTRGNNWGEPSAAYFVR